MTINTDYATRQLNSMEYEACKSMIENSTHSSVVVLPNHYISSKGEMHGFVLSAHKDDLCKALPFNPDMYDCICMFECNENESGARFNMDILTMLNNMQEMESKLREVLEEIQNEDYNQANLECMPDLESSTESFLLNVHDSRMWRPTVPEYVGIHHAFVRNHKTCIREHRMFLIIRGNLPFASEELYNLWHDGKSSITCHEMTEFEEVHWLRRATIRNHSRVAARVARKLSLVLNTGQDHSLPFPDESAIPTTVTFHKDMRYIQEKNRVEIVNGGCFTERSHNGILLDTLDIDGFWIFKGFIDGSNNNKYGIVFRDTQVNSFPTTAAFASKNNDDNVQCNLNGKMVHLLDENFMRDTGKLGFDRNEEVIHLMQIFGISNKTEEMGN